MAFGGVENICFLYSSCNIIFLETKRCKIKAQKVHREFCKF
jgi:hypothetical protein